MEVPKEVKREMSAVLVSKNNGVNIWDFEKDFRSLAGHPLHFRKYGFRNLVEMCEALPDVVR